MGERHTTMYCGNCKKQTAAIQPTANHILHLLITLLACGFWIPVWILCALFPGPKRCASCGLTALQGSFIGKAIKGVAVVMGAFFLVMAFQAYSSLKPTKTVSSAPSSPNSQAALPVVPQAEATQIEAEPPVKEPTPQPNDVAPAVVQDNAAIGRGFNKGTNDLKGQADSTPQEPIIATAENALKKYLKGKVQITGTSTVKILEAGRSWIVSGEFSSPSDGRTDFQSIILLVTDGKYEAGNLMLGDDVVMDKISKPKSAARPAPEPAEMRTWTSTNGKELEATFVSQTADKVKLKKADGKVITVNVEKLSEGDRKWIKARAK